MKRTILLLLAFLCIAIHISVWATTFRMEIPEDAYISFRMARNLAEGQGPVFNPGDRVEAYSNPLWIGVLALVHRVGLEMQTWAWKLSFLVYLVMLFVVWNRFKADGALAVFLVATHHCFLFHAVSGIETVPFLLTLLVLACAFMKDRITLTIGLGFLACVLRTDGAAYVGITLLAITIYKVRKKEEWKKEAKKLFLVLAGIALVYLPVLIGRHHYYGYWMPNTYYAKTKIGFWLNMKFGSIYFGRFLANYFLWFAAVMVGLVALAKESRRTALAITAFILLTFAYIGYVGGDTSSDGVRFFLPVILAGCLTPLLLKNRRFKKITIALLVLGSFISFGIRTEGRIQYNRKALVGNLNTVGMAFERALPEGLKLATSIIGKIGFFCHNVIILDPLGIADEDVAHRGEIIPWALKGHVKQGWTILLEEKDPDCFWIYPTLVAKGTDLSRLVWNHPTSAEKRLLTNQRFMNHYVPVPVKVVKNRYAVLHCKNAAADQIYRIMLGTGRPESRPEESH